MQFRTKISLPVFSHKISHHSQILCLGSCFAQEIGHKMNYFMFKSLSNPLGIAFNPVSLANHFKGMIEDSVTSEHLWVQNEGIWHSFYHHGTFSNQSKEIAITNIQAANLKTKQFIKQTSCVVITLGTANVFKNIKRDILVANNHKVDPSQFVRKKLDVQTCIESIHATLQMIRAINPDIFVLLTVSPIRHIRDGLIENQLSKSTLRIAVDEVVKSTAETAYFPSYEIMVDDLRDYRFYKDDMIHPTDMALRYIWALFQNSFMDKKTIGICQRIDKIQKSKSHRFIHPTELQIQSFVEKQLSNIEGIEKDSLGGIDLEELKIHFTNMKSENIKC